MICADFIFAVCFLQDKQKQGTATVSTDGNEAQEPLLPNPSPTTEGRAPHLPPKEDLHPAPSKLPRYTCKSVDEPDGSNCGESCSSSDRASDRSDGDLGTDISEDETPKLPDFTTRKDFLPLCAVRAGIHGSPMEDSPSGKLQGQWESPFIFRSHANPTATLAKARPAPVRAPVQEKAKAPQANLKAEALPITPKQHKPYDLLADFPVLRRPHGTNTNTKAMDKKGSTDSAAFHQQSGTPQPRRRQNVPREDSSLCAGDPKFVVDLQTFGSSSQLISATISCELLDANNQLAHGGNKSAKCFSVAVLTFLFFKSVILFYSNSHMSFWSFMQKSSKDILSIKVTLPC